MEIVSAQCADHELIDNTLRGWLYLVATYRDNYLNSEDDVAACSQKLIDSKVFCENQEYVRTQIIYSLLQEDETSSLNVIANFLLLDGRSDESTFKRMIDEGCFPRLVELINGRRDDDLRLHRLLLELMYEMSRIERLRTEDLLQVDDNFVLYMFQLIEGLSDDVDDPYHYPIIRVLLVLNEQYMVASTTAAVDPGSPTAPMTNRVIKILSLHGPSFRTFGENIILLLNRETETSLQLLILKLLYLLFTTKATYEYFYTNDLRVLLDVIIRNLLDLPDESMSLRHTYLRVLYPLLAHTQLSQPPHYKRDEIQKVLSILGGEGNVHFDPADETTVRLVERVSKVKWLNESGEVEVARKFLGISLSHSQAASNISVVDVAAVMEKPGVKTPSRRADFDPELKDDESSSPTSDVTSDDNKTDIKTDIKVQEAPPRPKKILPQVPKHRHGIPTITQTLHINGNGTKKLPPKAPPRRRTKAKPSNPVASDSPGTLHEGVPSVPAPAPVS
ncbi:putative ldb17 protein [Phaeoacremonium minimum UCRPA7]|uniref:Putative ldb17 protein n=1 Tax=Phaeoacremonium minimum (strain UCR-PA7) TaxID=1286976 RepID=R8BTF3_PHAM7|nr:putative ldb17 protein [Phaeoacremonium minimum UCRPA7]EOO02555.1 putative ldb17 protein [Phaeoacremonium minimum UCRPA7]